MEWRFSGFLCVVFAGLAGHAARADDVPPPKTPFTLTATLNTDLMDDVDGGLKRGALPVTDLEMAGSWRNSSGWRGYLDILVDGGGRFSQRYSGDLQSVSSIDAVPAAHLYEMWLRKTIGDARFVTTVGIINLNRIFDVQPVGGLFVNASSGIGPDYSQTAPSIYPITSLGVVSEWQPVKSFDGGRTATRMGSYGQYAKTIWRGGKRKLDAWLRLGAANSNALKISNYEGGGFALTGLLTDRPKDQAGLAVYRAGFGDSYRAVNPDTAPAETTVEATYQYQIKDGFTVQPDLQYVADPSGDRHVGHALVVGLRLKRKLADIPLP